MITYPTYQAAKIANPDSNIYRYLSVSPLFTCESECNGFSLQPANPADYCMTVKQFLDAGHKFVDGDFMLAQGGLVVKVSNCPSYNMLSEDDDKRYILSAKALEETNTIPTETPEEKEALDATNKEDPKNGEWWFCHLSSNENNGHEKPLLKLGNYWHSSEECRVSQCYTVHPICKMIFDSPTEGKGALDSIEKTYRYEKVEFDDKWKYFKLMHEEGDLYVNCVDLSFEGFFGDNINLANALHDESCIYRRIEVTERELFIDAYASAFNTHMLLVEDVAGTLFDSGKFKLVNGKG